MQTASATTATIRPIVTSAGLETLWVNCPRRWRFGVVRGGHGVVARDATAAAHLATYVLAITPDRRVASRTREDTAMRHTRLAQEGVWARGGGAETPREGEEKGRRKEMKGGKIGGLGIV